MHKATVGQERPELLRELGVSHATAIVVGTVIGSGIFRVPGTMMMATGSAKLVYLAWIVGGALSLFGAITYSELGAMMPQAGGEYVYVREAYGPLPAFLYAWTWFAVAKPASIATITTGLTDALSALPGFAFLSSPFLLRMTWAQLFAIAATILISGLNYIGVRKAGIFQLVFTILKSAMLVAIAAIGLSYAGGSWGHFRVAYPGAEGGFAGFVVALVAALWAYDGWNDLNMVAGEIRRPERTIPVALISGVGIVAALFMLMNAAVQFVLTPAQMAAARSPASNMAQLVLGTSGAAVITAGIALSMLVTLNGTVMSGARIPFAVARDGYFFPALARVHPVFHTPWAAIIVQAMLSVLLLLAAASFKQLLELAIFSEWLFYLIAASTIFVFRRRMPNAERPYRAWGYPVVPVLFIASAATLLYITFMDNLRTSFLPGSTMHGLNSLSAAGLLVILAGVPVFFYFARHKPSDN